VLKLVIEVRIREFESKDAEQPAKEESASAARTCATAIGASFRRGSEARRLARAS